MMDRRTSNRIGIVAFLGIVLVLLGAFVLIILFARRTADQAFRDNEPSSPAPAATLKESAEMRRKPAVAATPIKIDLPDVRFPVGYNFALAAHGGNVIGGTSPALLIDGNSVDYDGGRGFGYKTWSRNPTPSFLITLKEPSEIDCVRFLLWDIEENRYYRYKLELADSTGTKWTTVSDHTAPNEECRSWQVIRFEKRLVKTMRLTGTYNSANSGFHVVEFQACMAPENGFPLEKFVPHLPRISPTISREELEF